MRKTFPVSVKVGIRNRKGNILINRHSIAELWYCSIVPIGGI